MNTIRKRLCILPIDFSWPLGDFQQVTIVPTGHVPSFVKSSNVFLPTELCKKFSSGETRGLACVHFVRLKCSFGW